MFCINEKTWQNEDKTLEARMMYDCSMHAHWANVYKDGHLIFQTPYLDSQADVEIMVFDKFNF